MLKDVPPGNREVVDVLEGEEPDDFFGPLGGKTEYASKAVGDSAPHRAASCSGDQALSRTRRADAYRSF